MAETTEAAQTPTDASTSSEAAPISLLTGSEPGTTEQQQADPAKTPEGEPAVEVTKTEEAANPEGAPETYEFKAPEGKGEYDPAVLTTFSAAAKQANLSQDAAQKLLESMAPALAERQQAQVKAVQNGWLEASRTDKEFGGANLQSNLSVANTAYKQFASPELKTLLKETGFDNHPEFIRMMIGIGKSISEDKVVTGKQTPEGGKPDWGAIMYDKTSR